MNREEYIKMLNQLKNGTLKFNQTNWSIKVKDTYNEEAFIGKDNCIEYSYEKWKKLYPIGAKRARGLANNTVNHYPETNVPSFHCWVETDKLVFDETGFTTCIAPKKEWYEYNKISNVEYADGGLFLENNYELNTGPDSREMERNFTKFMLTKGKIVIFENYIKTKT